MGGEARFDADSRARIVTGFRGLRGLAETNSRRSRTLQSFRTGGHPCWPSLRPPQPVLLLGLTPINNGHPRTSDDKLVCPSG